MFERPTDLLFANTANFSVKPRRRAATRRTSSKVPDHVRKIGVIDYNAKAGLLFRVLRSLNDGQDRYRFYPVEAPMPMGLGRFSPEVIEKYRLDGREIDDEEEKELLDNVLVDDFQPHLSAIRSTVDVDTLVGVVAPMLAWTDEKTLHWNFFSVGDGSEAMVSTYELREFARVAGRTFEASVAMLIVAQVWSAMFDIEYHEDGRSCLFDFCRNRSDLTNALREIMIDGDCLDRIPKEERKAMESCLSTIRQYTR